MSKEDISEIIIVYNIVKKNKEYDIEEELLMMSDEEKDVDNIRIFGEEFVKNNKTICKMIIDDKEYKIIEKYNIINYNNSILEIKLKGIDNVTNMSYMLSGCSSLLSLPDISNWNTNNVTNMSHMFNKCSSLSSLPDISKWNTNKVTNMSHIFSECSSLSSLPDISNWNTNKVTNMSHIFSECSSLSSLHDISNWNTNNVTNMSYMLSGCSSLSSLPDISNWNTNNVTNRSYMVVDAHHYYHYLIFQIGILIMLLI